MNTQTLTPTRKRVIHERNACLATDLSPLKVSPLKLGAAALFDDLKARSSQDTPTRPLRFKQILFFLAWVAAAIITDTTFAIVQSLKCTLLLLCEVPKPWIDSFRALAPLWFTAFSVIPLVAAACASKLAIEFTERARPAVVKLAKPWTSLRASPAFQHLASLFPYVAVPSSAVPSAQSGTMPSPWASTKTDRPLKMFPDADEEQMEAKKRPPSPVIRQPEESTNHWPLPKSRTLNHVFSGISQSFSRSSLVPSRRTTNNSSTASLSDTSATTAVTVVKIPPPTRLPVSKSSRWSLGSHKSQPELSVSQDPCFIYESQPSAYWTGRFVSLHDKFQSEALTPKNMQSLIFAHSSRNKEMSNQRSRQSHPLEARYSRYNTRLPPSATSAAILQQTSGNMADAIAHSDAALLLDDDERCKRVFVHLEAFCATDEARTSLRIWQQEYARKTGRKKLLPKGGVMHESHSGSYISRIMGGKRMGKRASVM